MELKILLINQKEISWLRKIDKAILKKYEKVTVVAMMAGVEFSEKDQEYFKRLGFFIDPYKNFTIEKSSLNDLFSIPAIVVRQFVEKINQLEELKKIINYQGVNLVSVLANDICVIYYREFLLFVERLKSFISENKSLEILFFAWPSLKFYSPERPDISYLFNNELTYFHLTKDVCKKFEIPLIVVSPFPSIFPVLKIKIRYFIFTAAKFFKLLGRHFLVRLSEYKKYKEQNSNKKKVGVIIRASAEYYAIKSVLEKIKKGENDELQAVILQSDMFLSPQSWKILRRHQEEFISLYSLTSIGKFIKLFFRGLILQTKFKKALKFFNCKPDSLIQNEELVNKSIFTEILSQSYIIKEIFRSVANTWPETIIFIEELKRFIINYKPSALISMGMIDHWVAITSLFSDKYNIPTISFQTAGMDTYAMPSPIYANKFLVHGQEIKKQMIVSGNNYNKIFVTGAPKYDKYLSIEENKKYFIKDKIKKELNMPAGLKILLITTQPHDLSSKLLNDNLIDLAFKFLATHNDIYLIIKIHPRDCLERYTIWNNIIEERKIKAKIIQEVDVLDLIFISDILLSKFSTTILDALILGAQPVILLDAYTSVWVSGLDYMRTEATIKIIDQGNFVKTIESVLYDQETQDYFFQKRKDFINKSIGFSDGKASERAIKEIKSLIN